MVKPVVLVPAPNQQLPMLVPGQNIQNIQTMQNTVQERQLNPLETSTSGSFVDKSYQGDNDINDPDWVPEGDEETDDDASIG